MEDHIPEVKAYVYSHDNGVRLVIPTGDGQDHDEFILDKDAAEDLALSILTKLNFEVKSSKDKKGEKNV